MRTHLKTDLAYTAGLLDGEGYFGVFVSKRSNKKSPQFATRIAIINTNLKILEWLKETYGGSIQNKVKTAENSKQCWEWQIVSTESDRFVRMISPYLRIKAEQAEIYKDMRTRQKSLIRNRRCLPKTEFDERMILIQKMRALNKQGAS